METSDRQTDDGKIAEKAYWIKHDTEEELCNGL